MWNRSKCIHQSRIPAPIERLSPTPPTHPPNINLLWSTVQKLITTAHFGIYRSDPVFTEKACILRHVDAIETWQKKQTKTKQTKLENRGGGATKQNDRHAETLDDRQHVRRPSRAVTSSSCFDFFPRSVWRLVKTSTPWLSARPAMRVMKIRTL